MVAPLDIHITVRHQQVNYALRLSAAVKNIAYNVKPVNGKALYQLRYRGYKVAGSAAGNDGADDGVVVAVLVFVLVALHMQKLVENKFIVLRHTLANVASGVFA